MKQNRLIAIFTALAMLLCAIPSAADEANAEAVRGYVIDEFVRAAGRDSFPEPEADLSGFSDADRVDGQYRSSMALAVANGLIKGYDDNTLRPDAPVTRLEALIILGRCLPELDEKRPSAEFSDVPGWASGDIDRLYRAEIVNGYGGGILGSADLLSRAQVGLLVQRIEKTGEPDLKDDFYAAVNSGYLSSAVLSNDMLQVSRLDDISSVVGERMNAISRELVEKYSHISNPQGVSIEIEAYKLYTLALETYGADTGIRPIKAMYNRILGSTTLSDLADLNGDLIRDNRTPILFDITTPYKYNRSKQRLVLGSYVEPMTTGLDKGYWERGGSDAASAYEAYVKRLLTLIDFPNAAEAAPKLAELAIEIDKSGKTYAERMSEQDGELLPEAEEESEEEEDAEEEKFSFNYRELADRFGEKNPLCRTLWKINKDAEFLESTYLIIGDIPKTEAALRLMGESDIETLRALCVVNLIEDYIDFMPKPYRDASDAFARFVVGGGPSPTAESYATSVAASLYSDYYEARYLEKYSDFDRDALNKLVSDIADCFGEKFRKSASVSPSTAVKALGKLDKMGRTIAESAGDYEDKAPVYTMPPRAESMLEIGVDIYKRYAGSFYSTYTCITVPLPCYTVNASYSRDTNAFNIYAGILNPPMYSEEQTEEQLLAGIGFTIAHEISHAFDKSGSRYNSVGDYSKWWQEDDYERYNAKAAELTEIYSSRTTAAGNPIDGKLTSDENIADIMAMDCIITLAKQRELDMDALFRAYAAIWAELRSPEYDAYCAAYDVHSDGKTRVNAVLSNFDEFYETYGITEGDGMYVPPEKRIKFI